ncbi:MAG: CoA-transferase [Anaerolineales bacterium]|jgi:glutaconate CoA-transferase subunit B
MSSEYSANEMMIVSAARALAEARSVLVGVGLPNIACNLARRTVAPDLVLIYESGVIGARPARLPLSIGDPTIVSGAAWTGPMPDLFLYILQGGRIDAALLGTAQIDRWGNLNSTVIGPYEAPKVRLPGSGGACDIAINARRTLIITRLSSRTFVSSLDFHTTPGHTDFATDVHSRAVAGSGPELVITDRALFRFAEDEGEMELASLHPGVTKEQVEDHVGWPLKAAPEISSTPPPTPAELKIIREELDPEGLYR